MPLLPSSCKLWIVFVWLLVGASGCASLPSWRPPVDDLTPERKQRENDLIRQFETKRDAASLAAASNRWQQGDVQASRTILEELLQRNPQYLEARLLLADLHIFEERPLDAVHMLESAPSHQANRPELVQALAMALDVAGRADEAADQYRRSEEIMNSNPAPTKTPSAKPRNKPQNTWQGAPAIASIAPCGIPGNPDTDTANKSAASSSFPAESSSRRGGTSNLPSEPSHVMPAAHQVAAPSRISPAAAEHLRQFQAALRAGQPSMALDQARLAISHDPHNPHVPISGAVELLRYGHASLALDLLEPSLQSHPNSARLHQTLGLAYYRLANYSAACRSLEQALSLDNSNALSYFLLGSSQSKLGQTDAARQNLQRAASLDPQLVTRR